MKNLSIITIILILVVNLAHAQHCATNDYTVVAERIFSAMQNQDFDAFKMTAEQAGLIIKSNSEEENPFWTKMRTNIQGISEPEGWELISTFQLTDRLFIASYAFYTKPTRYITLTFEKYNNLWTLISFNYCDAIDEYISKWGFMLSNKETSNQRMDPTSANAQSSCQ